MTDSNQSAPRTTAGGAEQDRANVGVDDSAAGVDNQETGPRLSPQFASGAAFVVMAFVFSPVAGVAAGLGGGFMTDTYREAVRLSVRVVAVGSGVIAVLFSIVAVVLIVGGGPSGSDFSPVLLVLGPVFVVLQLVGAAIGAAFGRTTRKLVA